MPPSAMTDYTLHVGSSSFDFASATKYSRNFQWSGVGNALGWSASGSGSEVDLRIKASTTTTTTPTVTLSVSPNPVTEGNAATVTLSSAPTSPVEIPLTVTPVTAEVGDYTMPPSVGISAGSTTKTTFLTTIPDADHDHETVTVSLGTLPSGYSAGSTSSVLVTILDDEASPASSLTLSADRAPREGEGPVTVTATLDNTLSHDVDVYFSLSGTATWGGSDRKTDFSSTPDYWTPGSGFDASAELYKSCTFCTASDLITIPAGQLSASFKFTVVDDSIPDSGETIVVYARVQYDDGRTVHACWLGMEDTLTLTIANDENAETEAARLAAEEAAKRAAEEEKKRLAAARAAAGGPLSGLVLTAGSAPVALSPAFASNVLSYRATVPAGTGEVSLAPSWAAWAGSPSVWADSKTAERQELSSRQIWDSGKAVTLKLTPGGGTTGLGVQVLETGGWTLYRIEVQAPKPVERTQQQEETQQQVQAQGDPQPQLKEHAPPEEPERHSQP